MRSRSVHGGRHEVGQSFLRHRPTVDRIVGLVRTTEGPILEIGAGDGALTCGLAALGRNLTAIDIDEHRVERLRRRLPSVTVRRDDALRIPLDRPVVVGNIPFNLTTPILRRSLESGGWRDAIFLTQWEVARKRAGVGGRTMMTAQTAPWFDFSLHGRVPAAAFVPQPSVDGGILALSRRDSPLVHPRDRPAYERFVRVVLTGRGMGSSRFSPERSDARRCRAVWRCEPRRCGRRHCHGDLTPEQWAALWHELRR